MLEITLHKILAGSKKNHDEMRITLQYRATNRKQCLVELMMIIACLVLLSNQESM